MNTKIGSRMTVPSYGIIVRQQVKQVAKIATTAMPNPKTILMR